MAKLVRMDSQQSEWAARKGSLRPNNQHCELYNEIYYNTLLVNLFCQANPFQVPNRCSSVGLRIIYWMKVDFSNTAIAISNSIILFRIPWLSKLLVGAICLEFPMFENLQWEQFFEFSRNSTYILVGLKQFIFILSWFIVGLFFEFSTNSIYILVNNLDSF